jgi:amidase
VDRKTAKDSAEIHDGVTRRTFLGAGAAGGAALLTGGFSSILEAAPQAAAGSPIWLEKTIPQLQALMKKGQLTSRELTNGYLKRIHHLNPLVGAVIETNPHALAVAARRDEERRAGVVRGPMHGIPVLLKDNIAFKGDMETTAGSVALEGSKVPANATVANRLRNEGAVILGKANLSEWANFRGFAPFNGWSARGGFTRDPYRLDFDPCGSSSGSAVAPALNFCAGAVGSETDGSIVCPAGNNLVVGLKPTLGLLAGDGIIPIAHSQDTAGPMCRTVTDAAILLGAMQSPVPPVAGNILPTDYRKFLRRGSLAGKRIGVDRRYFTPDYGGEPDLVAVAQQGIDAMASLGARIIEVDTGDAFEFFDAEFTVLLFEFKVQIAEYLGGLSHTSMRTLADLIDFNRANCREEMRYFGQEIFELAEATSGDLNDPDYLDARALCLRLTREEGIDRVLRNRKVDAIVAPSYSFASAPAAVAGYPNIAVPVGLTPRGKPAGLWMYAGFLQEPQLLAMAYDLEQEIQPRSQPRFRGAVPDEPPDAGICSASLSKSSLASGRITMPYHLGTGKPFNR